MTDKVKIECSKCHTDLTLIAQSEASHTPCPNCGSFDRTIHDHVALSVEVLEGLHIKQKDPERKRPVREVKFGEFVGRNGKVVKKLRIIDRVQHRYREYVEGLDGTVIRDVDEDLREHRPSRQG